MKTRFSRKKAKEIAATSFGHVLDCVLGYSDERFDMGTESEEFESFFEEDLEEADIVITDKRIKIISEYYEQMRLAFIAATRKKYYNEKPKTND